MPALMWVGLIQSVEGLGNQKRLRGNSFSLTFFKLEYQGVGFFFLSCFMTQSERVALPGSSACGPLGQNFTIGSLGSQAFGFRAEIYHQFSWVSSLLTEMLGLNSLKKKKNWSQSIVLKLT